MKKGMKLRQIYKYLLHKNMVDAESISINVGGTK